MATTRSIATHTKRLLRLVDILKPLKPKQINMDIWAVHPVWHAPKNDNYCGTTACALGWAALDKDFNRAGLRIQWHPADGYRSKLIEGFPTRHGVTGYEAATDFFGLTDKESWNTFYGEGDTKDTVIAKLKRLAKNRTELDANATD